MLYIQQNIIIIIISGSVSDNIKIISLLFDWIFKHYTTGYSLGEIRKHVKHIATNESSNSSITYQKSKNF